MDNRKKLIVAILIILTISLGAGSIFISNLLQNSQAPTQSNASGFGETATKDLYEPLHDAFLNNGCVGLLSPEIVSYYARDTFSEVTKYTYEYKNLDTQDKKPVHCLIDLDSGRKIELEVHSYDANSDIASSKEALFTSTNTDLIKTLVTRGSYKQTSYFFGDGMTEGECVTTVFNSLNEFEYMKLVYKNFDSDCSDITKLNGEVSYVIGNAITDLITLTREKVTLGQ